MHLICDFCIFVHFCASPTHRNFLNKAQQDLSEVVVDKNNYFPQDLRSSISSYGPIKEEDININNITGNSQNNFDSGGNNNILHSGRDIVNEI